MDIFRTHGSDTLNVRCAHMAPVRLTSANALTLAPDADMVPIDRLQSRTSCFESGLPPLNP